MTTFPSRRTRTAALVAALLFAAAGCSQKPTDAKVAATATATEVEVAPVSAIEVERTVPLIGEFSANEQVTVAAQLEGRILAIGPDLGDRVPQGALLVRLDDAPVQAAIREVEAKLAKARADDARAQLLKKEGIMSSEEADRMRTEAQVLAAQLDVLRVRLAYTMIQAPLPGAIAARMVSAGEFVQPGRPLYRIVQDDPVKLRAPVPERFSDFVKVGQDIRVGVDAYPDKTFVGEITRVSPTSETANRSITIEAIVPNPEHLLKPGFFTRGDLVYDHAGRALAVPERALTTFAGVTKVFVVKDGKAEERVVRVGPGSRDGLREIENGVADGERVAVSHVDDLEQGAAVTVTTGSVATGKDPGGATGMP